MKAKAKTRKPDVGSELVAGMENALAHARGRKRAARLWPRLSPGNRAQSQSRSRGTGESELIAFAQIKPSTHTRLAMSASGRSLPRVQISDMDMVGGEHVWVLAELSFL